MRFAFVSLSLLLITLCRYSNASVSWTTYTRTSSATENKVMEAAKQSHITLAIDKILQIFDVLGNTIFAGVLEAADGTWGKMDKDHFFKKSLANGILCEFADAEVLSKKISVILYGNAISDDEHKKEVEEAKAAKFDCDGNKKDDECFCKATNPYNPFIYCMAKAMHDKVKSEGYTKNMCRNEAIAALKTKGTKKLGEAFDVNLVPKDDVDIDEEGQIDKLIKQGADLLCDTLDSDVVQGVKAVYAADALYWTIDLIIAQAIYGESEKDLKTQCDEFPEEVKKIAFAKCICDLDKGISFCYLYHAASVMNDSGFLNCKEKKFDDKASKPTALGIKDSASKAKKSESGSSGSESSSSGSESGSSGADQISMLASLAAAAALLL